MGKICLVKLTIYLFSLCSVKFNYTSTAFKKNNNNKRRQNSDFQTPTWTLITVIRDIFGPGEEQREDEMSPVNFD